MRAKILSLNIGGPSVLEWNGKSIRSSMLKTPIAGPLVVHANHIEGNTFASPLIHGAADSVLYAFALDSALKFMQLLGRDGYEPGALGETVTLEHFDETQISVGDVFRFGEVDAQATYPRIPCAKVDVRMQHARGRALFEECGVSGVYFRILKPGRIFKTDLVERVRAAEHRFTIAQLYRKIVHHEKFTNEEQRLAVANGAFHQPIFNRLLGDVH